jgi:geranylgeranyl transferase type-2 subunit beta
LLSTFTAIVTLGDLQALHELQLPLVQRYINSLAIGGGGFHGAALDPATDVEYTFYGIGSLALLHAPTS